MTKIENVLMSMKMKNEVDYMIELSLPYYDSGEFERQNVVDMVDALKKQRDRIEVLDRTVGRLLGQHNPHHSN